MSIDIRQSPCKDCQSRHILCHSECEKYIEFRTARDAFLEARNEHNMREEAYNRSHGNNANKHRIRIKRYGKNGYGGKY